jgi:flagellar motor switch protein FliM
MSAHLDPEEINALMSAVDEGRVADPRTEAPVAIPYDLTSQDRIIRGQMPTLDSINEQTASLVAMGISGRTRRSLQVTSAPAVLQKFIDLAPALSNPCVLTILTLGKGFGCGLLVLEPPLPELLLAAALGDRKAAGTDSAAPHVNLTAVEHQVLRRLLTIFTDAMRNAWAEILPLQPEILRFETDARMATIAPPNDVAICIRYEVTGDITGGLQLVIPYAAVETAKARLVSPPRANGASDQRFGRALAYELEQVKVEIRGILGLAAMKFQRLLDLDVGDVIVLSADETSPVPILVEGRRKLQGLPRISGGNLALEIQHALNPSPTPIGPLNS